MTARNEQRKTLVLKYASVRAPLVKLLKAPTVTDEPKLCTNARLARLPRDASPTRVVNRDALDGLPLGHYSKSGLGRIRFR